MKTLQKATILLFIIILTACSSNDDENNGTTDSGDDYFTAKVDGTDWEAFRGPPDTVAWSEPHTGLVSIQGSDVNGQAITMNIMNYNGTGTYDFTSSGFIQFVVGPTQANSGSWVCNSTSGTTGSVEITSVNGDSIEGIVSFTGKNLQDDSTKVISEGKFKASKE
jgi:hypothetical protein